MKIIFSTNGQVNELDLTTGNVKMLANVNPSRNFQMVNDYKYIYIFLPKYELERWLYYSNIQPNNRSINRVRLNGADKQSVFVLPNQITGLKMDTDQERIYWLDFDNGKVQSARTNGSDVKEIFDSGATTSNYDFVINGDNIYCTNYNKIIKFSKYPSTTSQVIFTDVTVIHSILVLSTKGKYRY
ncbi:unnamed protein product [Mytilus edulis]|uniref:Uncharacterized protein n=1 Tax=Mytilus edulis TaxID=6550 RepID=A0A8S3UM44_MYTED|nr:unnamed protein product [Mytilus edulis]